MTIANVNIQQQEQHKPINTVSAGNKKRKCPHPGCGKKLQLTDMACRCDVTFCAAHRLPETHVCTFNHAGMEWSRLVTRLFDEKVTQVKVAGI